MGLPLRIALPVLTIVGIVFIAIMAVFVKAGLTDNGTALGTGVTAQQGDARIAQTPAPVALVTDPPGTFTVPQTGTGPIAQTSALPGNAIGGGPPAPVAAELGSLQARLRSNPDDLQALVTLAGLYAAAGKYRQAADYDKRALAIDPGNPDALYERGVVLAVIGPRPEAAAAFKRFIAIVPDDPRVADARAALAGLGK